MTECIVSYSSKRSVKFFAGREELFWQVAEELKSKLAECKKKEKFLYLAVSGGSTPNPLYEMLASDYADINWETLKLFWTDERMVPGEHKESNYGTVKKLLLDRVSIPPSNIFFIDGAKPPEDENTHYSSIIKKEVPEKNGLPSFDLIWLGTGTDGHTASLFPGKELQSSTGITGISEHPVTWQKRITLTAAIINNSSEVLFIITGKEKEEIVKKVVDESDKTLPAGKIMPAEGIVKWYICLE